MFEGAVDSNAAETPNRGPYLIEMRSESYPGGRGSAARDCEMAVCGGTQPRRY